MKILFVCPFINNAHFMELVNRQLIHNVKNCEYELIVLNDAPDIDNGEENYLNVVSILSNNNNCYNEIKTEAEKLNLTHIKIPQTIHIKNRPNHGSLRHGELCNWFVQNFENLYHKHNEIDFVCFYDADLFLVKPTDFKKELSNVDFITPIIYNPNGTFWPQPSVFFINIKTVTNYKKLNFGIDYSVGNDMGSGIFKFWKDNPNYKIKAIGRFDGFQNKSFETVSETIKQIEGHYYDLWLNGSFVHLRWGWGGGAGESQHRNKENLTKYIIKMNKVLDKYSLFFDYKKWIKV